MRKTHLFRHWLEAGEDVSAWLNGSTITGIVYHGTDKGPFKQFAYQKSQRFVLFSAFDVESKGFFFAENPHDALAFGKHVAACYVRMTNPLVDPRRDKHLSVDGFDRAKEMHILKILGPMVQKDKEHGPFIDLGIRRVYLNNRRYSFAHEWIYEAIGPGGIDWDCLDNPEVIKRMQALGYDGTFVQESDTHIGRSIFVPSSDQIKIVEWVNGPQDTWGDKDDYGTKKVDGREMFYGPTTHA